MFHLLILSYLCSFWLDNSSPHTPTLGHVNPVEASPQQLSKIPSNVQNKFKPQSKNKTLKHLADRTDEKIHLTGPDEDGIRTHACRAQWISSPSP